MPNPPHPLVPNFNPGVGRLATDRYDFEAHILGTNFRHQANQIDMSPLITISGQQPTNVQDAIALLAAAITPPTISLATSTSPGIIRLGGDINGTNSSGLIPKVGGLQGFPVSPQTPSPGQVLTWNGNSWGPVSNSIVLNGDVTGAPNANTVIKVDGVSYPPLPSTNTVPVVTSSNVVTYQQIANAQVSNTAAISYSKLNLAGDIVNADISVSAAVAVNKLAGGSDSQILITNGTTPTWTTISGDTSITDVGLTTLNKIQGFIVTASGLNAPTSGQVLAWSGSAWTPTTPSGGSVSGSQVFLTSGTFICPPSVTTVTLTGFGGGGGGGGGFTNGSDAGNGGGGAGGSISGTIVLTGLVPGHSYTVTIGTGGAGGAHDINGHFGSDTIFAGDTVLASFIGASGGRWQVSVGGNGGTFLSLQWLSVVVI